MKTISRRASLALLVFIIACTTLARAQAPALREFNGEKVTAEEIKAIFDQVRVDPRARTLASGRYTTVAVIASSTYYFTKENDPAHPAVVRNALVTKDGESRSVFDGLYAGDEAAYKKMLADLEDSNKRMAGLWRGQPSEAKLAPRTSLATSEYLRSTAAYAATGKPSDASLPGHFQMQISATWLKKPPEGSLVVFEFENAAKGGAPTFVEQPYQGRPSLMAKSVEYPCGRDGHAYKIVARIYEDPAKTKLLGTHEQAVAINLPKPVWSAMRLKECE
jgi:hypothetical protein